MKKIKLLIGALCCITLLYFAYTLYPKDDKKNQEMISDIVWHTASEIDALPYSETYDIKELRSALIRNGYAQIDVDNIMEAIPASTKEYTRYCFLKMNEFSYPEGYRAQARCIIGINYNDKQAEDITSLTPVGIYTGSDETCVFIGNIVYSLTSDHSFYYNFYGSLHTNADTEVSFSGDKNDGSTLQIKSDTAGEFIKNISESESYRFSKLQP